MTAANLARLLHPSRVAVVGANEQLGMSNNAVVPMLEAGRPVHLVNPNRESLYGQPVFPSLLDLGLPIDAVLSLVNAERSIEVVEQAARLGCGGVVVAAAGFAELDDGAALQARLAAAAGDLAIIGPNCSGFKNVPAGANLFTGGRLDLRPGCLSVVSQSGFLVRAVMAAAQQRQLGIAIAISSGNEAVCDLADHVDALVADDATRVIALVIETIRRPVAFFEAVARAREAGISVLALKLGRGDRARRIMQSHTGAIADEAWVYDLAFREHGIIGARDVDDLLDRAQLLVQLPVGRQRPIERIGIITTSGGVAALAADLADEEGLDLPTLAELEPWVRERVPGDTVNPLDLTGFVMSQPEVMGELFTRYASAVDALVLQWWLGEGDEGWSTTLLEPFARAAELGEVPFIVSPVEATAIGGWTAGWVDRGLLFTRGIRSTYRAAAAVTQAATAGRTPVLRGVLPSSAPPPLVPAAVGPMVPFAEAMRLLADSGIATAPHVVVAEGQPDPGRWAELGDRLVVKLADVPHRTELGAVALGVSPSEVPAEVERLRRIARDEGVPGAVAVQAMVAGAGEAFTGLHARTALGPVVLFGLGGVLVELAGGVGGRFAPLDRAAASALVHEVAGPSIRGELRGRAPWPLEPLVDVVLSMGDLWQRHGAWLASVDVNPLIVTLDGVVAVDALLVADA
jgi:acyl-CoA synthetase (NDP forming)